MWAKVPKTATVHPLVLLLLLLLLLLLYPTSIPSKTSRSATPVSGHLSSQFGGHLECLLLANRAVVASLCGVGEIQRVCSLCVARRKASTSGERFGFASRPM